MAIWVLKDGQREGPYEEQDVRELIYEGTYTDSDTAIRDGQFDWTTLGHVLGRHPPLAASAPAPALVPPAPAIPAEAEELAEPADPAPLPEPGLPAALPPALPAAEQKPIPVAVVDFQMPFGSMVFFMVKWVIASIPAVLILGGVVTLFWAFCAMLLAALLRH